jgi:dTDP-glucose 4,6-dehydratase
MTATRATPGAPPRSLVAGGAGFLGSHLCERLVAEGHDVVCVDNLLTGARENLQRLEGQPRFRFLEHDVMQALDLAARLPPASRRLDYVLHLASPASPKDYARHPLATLQAGARGTENLLELARATGAVFLLASSSEVYGDPEVNPQPESYWGRVNPVGPRSVYDEAKRYAEALTMAYHRAHGVRVRVARIFNTYGERMRVDDGRVLPNFLMQALQGRPLTVYGDGSQTRSFCYISDMVEGLYRLLLSDEAEPINLGNPEEVTMAELAREILAVTGSKSALVTEPLPTDDPRRRRPDITRAQHRLGWRPRIGRREGLERVLPYFKAKVEALCAR